MQLSPALKLSFRAYFTLIGAILIGMALSTPFIITRVRAFAETNYLVNRFPADDTRLKTWALAQPGVVAFEVEHKADELRIRSEYLGPRQRPSSGDVIAQMRAQGYEFRGMRGGSSGLVSTIQQLITDAPTLAVMLGATQLAFGCIGLAGIRRARLKGQPLPPLFAGNRRRAIVSGVVGAFVLLGFGHLYGLGVESLMGKPPPSPWAAANAMPTATKMIFLLFGGLGAPLAEEIFFRGYLFGKFKAAGCIGLGLIVTSFLFGVVHFTDPYNIPAICLIGGWLAWSFHRTESLMTPIITHAINNSVQILWLVFA